MQDAPPKHHWELRGTHTLTAGPQPHGGAPRAAPTQVALPACPGCEGCQAGPPRQRAAASTFLPAGGVHKECTPSPDPPPGMAPQLGNPKQSSHGDGEVPGIATASPATPSVPGPMSPPAAPRNAPLHRGHLLSRGSSPDPTTRSQLGPTRVQDPHRCFGDQSPVPCTRVV